MLEYFPSACLRSTAQSNQATQLLALPSEEM